MVVKPNSTAPQLARYLPALFAAVACFTASATIAAAQSKSFSIGLWGDMPYVRNGDAPKIPPLIADEAGFPEVIGVDVEPRRRVVEGKGGIGKGIDNVGSGISQRRSSCSDEPLFRRRAGRKQRGNDWSVRSAY